MPDEAAPDGAAPEVGAAGAEVVEGLEADAVAGTAAKRLAVRARQLATAAPGSVEPLPTPAELARLAGAARRARLEELRVELYAASSILADGILTQARQERAEAPPYGLVLSRHTDLRMIVAHPGPVKAGAVTSFHALGKAYVDTTVHHLHRYLGRVQAGDQRWLFTRLEGLLELFRRKAAPATQARMRDGASFLYGGLQFGTGVTVQLAEAMAALLADAGLSPSATAEILARSGQPAHKLASCNLTEVVGAYQRLQSPTRRTTVGTATQGWMDPARFVVREHQGRPWRVELRDDEPAGPAPGRSGGVAGAAPSADRFPTQGCPARISPTAAVSPITTLWSWCIELAEATGLLGPAR